MPVPIVIENHLFFQLSGWSYHGVMNTYDGLKFLTTRRQPTLYFEGRVPLCTFPSGREGEECILLIIE